MPKFKINLPRVLPGYMSCPPRAQSAMPCLYQEVEGFFVAVVRRHTAENFRSFPLVLVLNENEMHELFKFSCHVQAARKCVHEFQSIHEYVGWSRRCPHEMSDGNSQSTHATALACEGSGNFRQRGWDDATISGIIRSSKLVLTTHKITRICDLYDLRLIVTLSQSQ